VIHEETTTEIEIPGYQKKSNVVAVQFGATTKPSSPDKKIEIASAWDFDSRWVWRLLAVFSVLLLSLLML
jgi:hypothetical protein